MHLILQVRLALCQGELFREKADGNLGAKLRYRKETLSDRRLNPGRSPIRTCTQERKEALCLCPKAAKYAQPICAELLGREKSITKTESSKLKRFLRSGLNDSLKGF